MKDRRAMSLLEILVAVSVLSIGLLAVAIALVPGQRNLEDARNADRATECGQVGTADAVIRGVLNPRSWRNTDKSEIWTLKPTLAGAVYQDETGGYPWGESYVIDPIYLSYQEVVMAEEAANPPPEPPPHVAPEHYTAFPYRPEQIGTTMLGESWTKLRRITSTNGGGFSSLLAQQNFTWRSDGVFTRDKDGSRGKQLFQTDRNDKALAPHTEGRWTWLLTVTPTPEPVWFTTGTQGNLTAYGRYPQLFHVSTVVFFNRDLTPAGRHTPGEPPAERQVQLEFLGDGYGGGDVRLRVFGDPADPVTWQPTEYLDVRKNRWLLVTGKRTRHRRIQPSADLPSGDTLITNVGEHHWYRIVQVADVVEDGSPPWREATLAGPDWHSDWCVDLNGDGQSIEAIAGLFDGIIGVFTSLEQLY